MSSANFEQIERHASLFYEMDTRCRRGNTEVTIFNVEQEIRESASRIFIQKLNSDTAAPELRQLAAEPVRKRRPLRRRHTNAQLV